MLIKVFIEKKRGAKQKSPSSEALLRIYKNVGDRVAIGDLLFITADDEKVNEYASNMCGVVRKVYCHAGERITPDTPVLEIMGTCKSSCQTKEDAKEAKSQTVDNKPIKPERVSSPDAKVLQKIFPIKATSYAKMLAKKLGLSLDSVKGTGPGDWITRSDVLSCAAEKGLISSDSDFDDSSLFANTSLQEVSTNENEPTAYKITSCQKCDKTEAGDVEEKADESKANDACSLFKDHSGQPEEPAHDVKLACNQECKLDQEPACTAESKGEEKREPDSECVQETVQCSVRPHWIERQKKEQCKTKCGGTCELNLKDKPVVNQKDETEIEEKLELSFEVEDKPQLAISSKINVTKIVNGCRRVQNVNYSLSVCLLSYFVKALAKTLNSFPIFNSTVQDDGQFINNENIILGLVAGSSNYCKSSGICSKNAHQLSIKEIAGMLKELRTNKYRQKESGEDKPTFIIHDLMQYGSKSEIEIEQSNLAVFSVEDIFKVFVKNTQTAGQTFYFAPFTFIVDQRFIDDDLAYDFVDVFKETIAEEIDFEPVVC